MFMSIFVDRTLYYIDFFGTKMMASKENVVNYKIVLL